MHNRDSISAGVVYDIDYRCRPIGYDPDDVDEGSIRAYWTGEIDCWGKHTFRLISPVLMNNQNIIYLFRDEILDTARCGVEGRR